MQRLVNKMLFMRSVTAQCVLIDYMVSQVFRGTFILFDELE